MRTKHISPQQWADEFTEFMSAEEIAPPSSLSNSVLSKVHADLNPGMWLVFTKLSFIHAIIGTLTLLFCPQFGISLFDGMGLMSVFMRWGEHACMLGCGAVFLGGSTLVSSLVLRPEEIKVLRKTKLIQLSTLSMISVAVFICTGAAAIGTLAAFWLIGSLLGSVTTLELGWLVRTWFRKRLVYGL